VIERRGPSCFSGRGPFFAGKDPGGVEHRVNSHLANIKIRHAWKDAGRILVRCPNWVGDVVMAAPAFRCIREHCPGARITAVIRRYAEGVVRDAPWFDAVLGVRERGLAPFFETLGLMRSRKADLAVLFTNSFRSALELRLAGCGTIVGYRRDARSLLLSGGPIPSTEGGRPVPRPMGAYYLDLCRWMGMECPGDPMPELFVSNDLHERARVLLKKYGIGDDETVIGLNPGARFGSSKCWPPEHFARLAEMLEKRFDCRVMLFTGPGEQAIGRAILEKTRARIVDTGPDRVDLELLKPLVKRCRLLVTNDTGPRHYAVALGVPAVVLLGPTDPRYTALHLDNTRVVSANADCAPCHLKTCPVDHRCMKDISPEQVAGEAEALLAGKGVSP
jgi:heptosyltransferase-2